MSSSSPSPAPLQPLLDAEAAARMGAQVNTLAWGLFFVWLGVIWFAGVNWNWAMVGIGVIFLAESIFRGARNLKISGVSVMFGIIFLAGGIWGLASSPFALLPAMFVLFGVAMVWRAVAGGFRRG